MTTTPNLSRLIDVMARLRSPDGGCPWDLEQDFKTIASYALEETYELVEAVEQDDPKAIAEELGDVLFQVVFHAQLGSEAGLFDLDSVAAAVADKMVERHPHVFGDRDAKTSEAVLGNWEADKAAKRAKQAAEENRAVGALDGVSTALPATTRAIKLQNRAAHVGFDWSKARDVLAKIKEEIAELEIEINKEDAQDAMEDELGDVFFALINLARHLKVDPETALRRTNRKFENRFRVMEAIATAQSKKMEDFTLVEQESLWVQAKKAEMALTAKMVGAAGIELATSSTQN